MGPAAVLRLEANPTARTARRNDGAADGAVDLEALEDDVGRSDAREAYRPVSAGVNHRLGVVAAAEAGGGTRFSIELVVRVPGEPVELGIRMLETAARVSRDLTVRGYALVHQGDGWMSWEKAVPREEVIRECAALRNAVDALSPCHDPVEESSTKGETGDKAV